MNRRKFYKLGKKLAALILCFCLTWSAVEGLSAHAYEPNGGSPGTTGTALEDQLSSFLNEMIDVEGATEVYQMEETADNELALKMEDGTVSVYSFSEPIKFEDENGEIKFKDTTIVEQTDTQTENEGFAFTNGDNEFSIDFSENVDTGIKVSDGNSALTLTPIQSEDVPAQDGEAKEIENLDSKIESIFSYEDVFGAGSRIEYSPQLNGLKENIILEQYTGQNSFDFILDTHGNTAELVDGSVVEIKDNDTDEIVNTLLPLFAYDSYDDGEYSTDPRHYTEDCTYTLTEQGDGTYKLTVVVSEDWLTATTTVYPVTIDPTLTYNYTGMDTALYSKNPNTVYNNATNNTGYSSTYGKGRAMFKFAMPSAIPTGAKIVSAQYYFRETTAKSDTSYVGAHMINSGASGWTSGTATWNLYADAYDAQLSRKNINSTSTDVSGSNYWYKFAITSAVQKWINGTNANRGIMLVSESEGTTASWRAWASIRHGTSSYKPYCNINYEPDTTAPTITSVTGNPTAWTNKDVTLTVNATDNVGVKEYSFDNGATWQSGKTKKYSTNTSNIKIKVRDYAGNPSATTTVSITKIDKNVPAAPSSVTVSPTIWTNGNITVTHTAASSNFTITKYQYAISTSNTTAPTSFTDLPSPTALTHTLTAPKVGTQYVWVRAVNVNGNGAAKCSSAPYKRDVTVPVAPSSVTISPTGWTKGNITVTHTATNSNLTITRYEYAISTSNTAAPISFTALPSPTALSHVLTIPKENEGTKYIWVRAVNANGNGAAKCSSTPYKLDVTPPSIPTLLDFVIDQAIPGNKKLIWSGVTDALSGVAKIEYKLPGGSYVQIPQSEGVYTGNLNAGSYSFPCPSDVESVMFKITDNATNSRETSTNLDIEAPTNFVAKAMVSMSTRLAWVGEEYTGVTYDIYASDTQNGTYEKIAQDITGNYWFDYTVRTGTRYYKVKAKATICGQPKTSPFSDVQSAISVIPNNYIGIRPHEQLLPFDITSGTGMVHPISGNLYYSAVDASTNSASDPVSFTRSYNSLGDYSTGLGSNWDHNLNIMLLKQVDANGNEIGMLFKDGTGALNLFTKNQNGSYTRPAGLYAWLTQGSNGNYVMEFKDGTTYFFNKSNQLEEIESRFGKKMVFIYRSDGNLEKVSNVFAEAVLNSSGEVVKEAVADELKISYLEEVGKTDMIASVTAASVTTYYEYDSNNRLIEVYKENGGERASEQYTYTNGKLTTITNANEQSYTIAYNGTKAVSITDPKTQVCSITYNQDGNGNYIVARNFLGKITQQKYTVDMELFAVAENGNISQYEYDVDYNVTKVITPTGKITQSTYDNRGNVLTETAPGNLETTYTYAAGRDVPTQVDAPHNGNLRHVTVNAYNNNDQVLATYVVGSRQKTFNTYDANGNLTKTVQVTGDGAEALTSYTQAVGSNYYVQETQYTYDEKDRLTLTKQIGENYNRVTEQTYDDGSNRVVRESNGDIESGFRYDDIGQLKESETTDGEITETESVKYDAMGNVVEQTSSSGTTTTEYDNLGRIIRTVDESGLITEVMYTEKSDGSSYTVTTQIKETVVQNKQLTMYDQWGNETLSGAIAINGETGIHSEEGFTLLSYMESTYDGDGKETECQDGSGIIAYSTYDARDNLISQTISKGNNSETTSSTYDDAGNVLTETAADGKVTTYTYDVLGRVLTTTLSKDNDSLCAETNEFDVVENGNLVNTVWDAKGRSTTSYTDELGDLIKETIGTKTTVNVYNENGQLLSCTLTDTEYPNESSVVTCNYTGILNTKKTYAPGHFVDYTYNDQGRVVSETIIKGAWSNVTEYTYDNSGNISSMTRNGDIIEYTYTPAGNIETLTYGTNDVVKYEYDSEGKVLLIRQNNTPIQKYEYNADRQLINVLAYDSQENGYVDQTYAYDWKGNPTEKTYYDRQGNEKESYDISYEDDKITSEVCEVSYSGAPIVTTKEYEYDWLDRLIVEAVNGAETEYTYDEVGNRLSMDDGTDIYTYTYNDADQLLNEKKNNAISQSYEYDLNGNQISRTKSGVTTNYIFDATNHLEKVIQGVNTLGEYTYDASGQRLSKTVDSLTTQYYYDGIDLLYTKEDDQVFEISYHHPTGGVIKSVRGADAYFYRDDSRGSISNILDDNEDVVESYTYDAYGNTAAINNTFKSSFAYTGAVIDRETGLYYLNARYYDPETARFISEDPVRDGQSWYMYCQGDPVNNVDPTGCFSKSFNTGKRKIFNNGSWYKSSGNASINWIYNKKGTKIGVTVACSFSFSLYLTSLDAGSASWAAGVIGLAVGGLAGSSIGAAIAAAASGGTAAAAGAKVGKAIGAAAGSIIAYSIVHSKRRSDGTISISKGFSVKGSIKWSK